MRFGTSPTALNASASNCWRTGRWTSRVPRTSRPYAYCVVMLVHDGTNAVARSAECGARGDNSRGQEKRPADGLASEMAGDGPERPYGAARRWGLDPAAFRSSWRRLSRRVATRLLCSSSGTKSPCSGLLTSFVRPLQIVLPCRPHTSKFPGRLSAWRDASFSRILWTNCELIGDFADPVAGVLVEPVLWRDLGSEAPPASPFLSVSPKVQHLRSSPTARGLYVAQPHRLVAKPRDHLELPAERANVLAQRREHVVRAILKLADLCLDLLQSVRDFLLRLTCHVPQLPEPHLEDLTLYRAIDLLLLRHGQLAVLLTNLPPRLRGHRQTPPVPRVLLNRFPRDQFRLSERLRAPARLFARALARLSCGFSLLSPSVK